MADGATTSLKSRVSEAEWNARVELAALYRLVALHGWDDMIFTHISARDDAHFVIHLHTVAGVGVAAQKEGLLPLGQNACLLQEQVAYHGYEGLALNHDERERLVADLGDKPLMLLRNHGTLAVGQTAAQAWIGMFFLERACAQQVAALSVGRDHVLMAPEAAQAETREQGKGIGFVAALAWPGALRMLDRRSPGYDV